MSSPRWRWSGVTNFRLLWRCSVSYQRANCCDQRRVYSKSSKGWSGESGWPLRVLNKDSEYGLSLLTAGRLKDGDAQALQGGEHRAALHGRTVVGMQDQGFAAHTLAQMGLAEVGSGLALFLAGGKRQDLTPSPP